MPPPKPRPGSLVLPNVALSRPQRLNLLLAAIAVEVSRPHAHRPLILALVTEARSLVAAQRAQDLALGFDDQDITLTTEASGADMPTVVTALCVANGLPVAAVEAIAENIED